jgi:hypothetical protein
MGGDGEAACSETPSLLSCILRCVSFAEVGSVCRVALRELMYLCTCVSEEVGDREGAEEGGDASNVLYGIGRAESAESASFVRTCEDCKKGEPRNVTRRNTNVNSATVSASL